MRGACPTARGRAPRLPRGRLLAVALGASLAACSTIDVPQLSPPVPQQWRHAAPAGPVATDLHGWWHQFNDPQLDALVDQALAQNLAVAAAVERLRAARSLYAHANDRFKPQLSGRTENAIEPSARAAYLVAGFDASWEIGVFGRPEANRRMLRGDSDAAAAQLDEVRVSLVGEVVADWLALGAAQEQARLLTRIRELRERRLTLLRIRAGLGLAAEAQLAEAEAAVARAGAALLDVQQAIDESAQKLALLLGRSEPEAMWLQGGRLAQLGEWSLTQTPAELLRTRPEILRAEGEVLRAAGEAGLARSDLLPSVAIGGSVVWSALINENRPTNAYRIGTIGPLLDVPLFDWGQRLAVSHARAHALKASVLAYREAVLQGVAEVENALGNLQRQRERELLQGAAVSAVLRAAAAASRRVELSLASPVEQQAAGIAQAEAELELTQARAARGVAYVALFKALGGAPLPPVDPPERESLWLP